MEKIFLFLVLSFFAMVTKFVTLVVETKAAITAPMATAVVSSEYGKMVCRIFLSNKDLDMTNKWLCLTLKFFGIVTIVATLPREIIVSLKNTIKLGLFASLATAVVNKFFYVIVNKESTRAFFAKRLRLPKVTKWQRSVVAKTTKPVKLSKVKVAKKEKEAWSFARKQEAKVVAAENARIAMVDSLYDAGLAVAKEREIDAFIEQVKLTLPIDKAAAVISTIRIKGLVAAEKRMAHFVAVLNRPVKKQVTIVVARKTATSPKATKKTTASKFVNTYQPINGWTRGIPTVNGKAKLSLVRGSVDLNRAARAAVASKQTYAQFRDMVSGKSVSMAKYIAIGNAYEAAVGVIA